MKSKALLVLNLTLLFVNLCFLTLLFWKREGVSKGTTNDTVIDIVFFAGGSEDDYFAPTVAKGALLAGDHLGCKVRVVWSQWDVEKMTQQFKEELEKRPDAICMMGHPGMERLGSFVKEARRKGIIITFQNVDIPTMRESYIQSGAGYVGQNLENSGRILAEGMIRKYGLQPGEVALVFQSYEAQSETRGKRGRGVVDALRQQGLIVHSISTPYEFALDSSTPEARAYIREKLSSAKDLSVVVNDGIMNNEPIIDELKRMGYGPGGIKYGTFDLSRASVKHLKTGYIGIVHDQQPLLQGYYSVLQAYMAKKYRFSGLAVDTGLGLIDADILKDIEHLYEAGLR